MITKASLFSLQSVRLLHDNQVNSAGDSNDHRGTHKSLHKMSVYFWAESLCLYILSYLVLTITTKVGDTNPQMLREFINLSRIIQWKLQSCSIWSSDLCFKPPQSAPQSQAFRSESRSQQKSVRTYFLIIGMIARSPGLNLQPDQYYNLNLFPSCSPMKISEKIPQAMSPSNLKFSGIYF